MLTENILHPLLQQMLKMASFCTDTSSELSPFVTRQSPHRQLSAVHQTRPHSDTAAAIVISYVSEIIQSDLPSPFVLYSFISLL